MKLSFWIKFVNWFLVISWAGLIFVLSSQPDLKSSLPTSIDFILRKIAHMTEYGILFFLLFRAIREHSMNLNKTIWLAIIFSILYAITDEYHQAFVFGRMGTLRDVLIDSAGILGAFLITNKRSKIWTF